MGWHVQQVPGPSEIGGALSVGEEAVMADPVEAFGEDVEEKAANELVV